MKPKLEQRGDNSRSHPTQVDGALHTAETELCFLSHFLAIKHSPIAS